MIEVLSYGSLVAAIAVLGSSCLNILVRILSRNDRHKVLVINDFSIALEVLVATITVLASKSIEYLRTINQPGVAESLRLQLNDQLPASIYLLIVLFGALWIVSTIIRKFGWQNETELDVAWGVVLPNLASFLILFYVFTKLQILIK